MTFSKNIFGDNFSEENKIDNVKVKYYTLNSISQLDEIDEISYIKPVLLFKHSTRCIISRTVLKQFETEFNFSKDKIDWYLLDLLNYREVSNEIAHRYNITHQSPQILVIKNGKTVFNESHDGILAEDLKQFL